MVEPQLITIGDVTKPIRWWCERNGIPLKTAYSRLNRWGWTPEEAVTVTPHERTHRRLLYWRGRYQCLNAWARERDLHPQTLRKRLDVLGWPLEQALLTPTGWPKRVG